MTPTFTLTSPQNGTAYHVYVSAPLSSDSAGPRPAMLFLDGDDQFAAAVSAYTELRDADAVPPLLLVGVGYGASYSKPGNHRGRDYTPVHHLDEPSSGGADAFLDFVTTTLWEQLTTRYDLAPQRGIAGHSLGSLFALHALFQAKPFFTYHLASAPSIWWANRALLAHVERLRVQQEQLPAKLFLSVGERDSHSMTEDLALLEQQLAARPFNDLIISSQRFPKKNHFNVIGPAFKAGLAALFGPVQR